MGIDVRWLIFCFLQSLYRLIMREPLAEFSERVIGVPAWFWFQGFELRAGLTPARFRASDF